MKAHHKRLIVIALIITIVAWLAWTLLVAESDVAPQGRLQNPGQEATTTV